MRYRVHHVVDDRPPQRMEFWQVRDTDTDGFPAVFSDHRQCKAETFAVMMNATYDASLCCDLVLDGCLAVPREAEPDHCCGHCRRVLMYQGPCWMCRNALEIRS